MRVAQINGGVFGSTGKIMFGIAEMLEVGGHSALCASPVTTTNRTGQPNHTYYKIGGFNSRRLDVLAARVTGLEGHFAYFATRSLIKEISAFNPDVIHLHTIHGSFINLPLLFNYIKENNIKTVWTLHDCWPFTGHCPHFTAAECDMWKTGCANCPLYKEYPESLFDNSSKMYRLKKKWFSGLPDCTLVTPSSWLGGLLKQSFLSQYSVRVIHNGTDRAVFRPTPSDFRDRFGCRENYLILGVAFGWSNKKGLDVFIRLAEALPERYKIVLVGTNEKIDELLPSSVISIHRTRNQSELAQIYTEADVFVNPTREDNFPTVNMEALACGTPVVTFDVGGSAEIPDRNCGIAVKSGDFEALINAIKEIEVNGRFDAEACLKHAKQFDCKKCFKEYIDLYDTKLK